MERHNILRGWREECVRLSGAHLKWSVRFKLMHRTFGVIQVGASAAATLASIIVRTSNRQQETTVISPTSLVTDIRSQGIIVPEHALWVPPTLSMFATLMLTLGVFFGWNVRGVLHNIVSNDYATIARDIECVLAHDDEEKSVLTDVFAGRMATIASKAPILP
jgi:hypothetical protein